MRRPRPRLPRPGIGVALGDAIECRVSALLPQHQAKGEAAILEMLRAEFGTPIDVHGEANQKRAIAMVRAWEMR